MQLSNNFTLAEFTISQEGERRNIDNRAPDTIIPVLVRTANNMEIVRKILGQPILISSGYRCPELNEAIGGSKTSQHVKGEAVDFISPKFGTPAQIVEAIRYSRVAYDQLILEYGRWVHISFTTNNRRQVLVIDSTGTRAL